MQAFLDGKEIQLKPAAAAHRNPAWQLAPVPVWDWYNFIYRVKPVVHELWANVYRGDDGTPKLGYGFETEDRAKQLGAGGHPRRIAIVKITFTEGEGL